MFALWNIQLKNAQGKTIPKPSWAGSGNWSERQILYFSVPTTTNTLFGQIDLPFLKVSANTPEAMLSQSYDFEINVYPEPSSLLALAGGLGMLLALRRRLPC